MPATPADLAKHQCISTLIDSETKNMWRLQQLNNIGSPIENLRFKPCLASNDAEVATHWATSGLGIVMRWKWAVQRELENKSLIQVLENWSSPTSIYMQSMLEPEEKPLLTKFVEFLKAEINRRFSGSYD